jgi:hypothetical protein
MRKTSAYIQAIHILQDLHKLFPNYNMGRHLSTALDGYGDVWGMTDKELVFALEKYKTQLEMDNYSATEDEDLAKIIKDGIELDNIFKDEEDPSDY